MILRLACVVVPLLVIASLWAAPLSHHYVRTAAPPADIVDRLRREPDDKLLRELADAKHTLVPPLGMAIEDPIGAAEALLAPATGGTGEPPQVPFNPHLLGSLDYASMLVPRVLMKAYIASDEERYFDAARQFVAQWADFELNTWLPQGLVWNDHAIAVRSVALAEFWRLYRDHAQFDPVEARRLLRLVLASSRRLADPALYTHASNHGTMQNVGLMHYGLAFPLLDGFAALPDLALERQLEQISYMISPSGFVLEHSAGYHRLGMELLAVIMRYRTLQGGNIPASLAKTYRRTLDVYAQLRAADGTLPPLGDTSIAVLGPAPLTTRLLADGRAAPLRRLDDWPEPRPVSWYSDAGFAVWWTPGPAETAASQTTIGWSRFNRHGHKHADELGFNLRTGPVFWWRSVGYWPLDHALRPAAVSWTGSNAPHLVGEPAASERRANLVGIVSGDTLRVVDLERFGPRGFRARRQIVHVQPDIWLTIDTLDGAPGRNARIVWTSGSDVALNAAGEVGRYTLIPASGSLKLHAAVLSPRRPNLRLARAETDPFVGWVEDAFVPQPADALIVTLPADDTWVAHASLLGSASLPIPDAPRVAVWEDAESWKFAIPTASAEVIVSRRGQRVAVERAGHTEATMLDAVAQPSPWQLESARLHALAESRYGPHVADLIPYRKRMSGLLGALLLAQEVLLVALSLRWRGIVRRLRALVPIGWAAIAVWLHGVYFIA